MLRRKLHTLSTTTVAAFSIAAAAAIGMTVLLPAPAAADTTLRLETYAGPKHAMNTNGWPEWIKDVEEASKGGINVRMTYPPINPRDLYDRVREGIADVAWITHGYTTGRFVLTEMIELPGMDGNAEQMSRALWRIYTTKLADKDEHRGVKLLALFTHGPGMIHTRNPVTSVADLNGMKVRTGGGVQGEIAKRLGIVTVSAPAPQAQEILQQGVADGIFFSIETITSFNLGDIVKHHYSLPGGLYTASFAVVMNQRKWDSLSDAEKATMEKVTGEHMSAIMGRTWDGADKVSVEALTAKGNTISPLDEATAKTVSERIADIEQGWIERAKAEGVADPAAVLAALRAEIQKLKSE